MQPIDLKALPRSSWILAEEHSSAVHPLTGARLFAKNLYRLQESTFRRIVWDGGEECSRRGQEGWRLEPCTGDGTRVLQGLEALLASEVRAEDEGLDDASSEALEALGYL